MSDRIPCLVLGCRRTAAASKYPPGTEIICGKCWRQVPKAIRNRIRDLRRTRRTLRRRWAKKGVHAPNTRCLDSLIGREWDKVKECFAAPDKPAGLDAFLEEAGLA